MKIFILCCLLATSAFSIPLNPEKVVIAINTGADYPITITNGIYFQADTGHSGNTKTSDYNTNSRIAALEVKYTPAASDSNIYKTERHSTQSFSYSLAIPNPGTYVLITKYAEMWFKDPKKRMFNLKFGDCLVAEKIDIVGKVGRFAAYDEYTEFEYKNGQIYYQGKECHDALDGNRLIVTFEHLRIDNPMVNGILLYAGSLKDTDYEDIPRLRDEWEQRQLEKKDRLDEEMMKKPEKHRQRNDVMGDVTDTEDAEYELPAPSSMVVFDVYLLVLLAVIVGSLAALGQFLRKVEFEPTDEGNESSTQKGGRGDQVDSKATPVTSVTNQPAKGKKKQA
mmetsp:Transcript_35174/g.41060  ORF Transcript_35174/g.41060 Transcript_35174/m.41060 type:complete len:337 (-) Transcript_35174:121-1131(-)